MPNGFPNKPKILRGAFVEFGLTLPPLLVVFQFNPLQLTRNRSITYSVPNKAPPERLNQDPNGQQVIRKGPDDLALRDFHQKDEYSDLLLLQKDQQVSVGEQSIGFEIRLDATDKLNDRDAITEQFGIMPQLATLELMVYPKDESLLGKAVSALLGKSEGFSFTRGANPPLILFIWGRKRVLPVNINSMNITETEFSTDLNPIRATISVSLTVIEGKSIPYLYSKAMIEAMSVLHLANITEVANVVIPG